MRKKKYGFTLLEIILVIVILGLIAGYMVTRISDVEKNARDVRRNTDIITIATALITYKQDHGEFPMTGNDFYITPRNKSNIHFSCIETLNYFLSGYLSSIPRDPTTKGADINLRKIGHGACIDPEDFSCLENNICSNGYGYLSNGKNFAIICAVEQSKNGNTKKIIKNPFDIGKDLNQLLNSGSDSYSLTDNNRIYKYDTGDYYMYIYE